LARIEELAAQIQEARTLRHQAAREAEAFVTSVHSKLAGRRNKMLGEILSLDENATPILPMGSYPQVGVKSFGGGLFAKGAVAGTETSYRRFNRLYEGALLLSQVKGWEGAVAVCPAQLAGWFVSPEYRTFRCIPTEARPGYLAALVDQSEAQCSIELWPKKIRLHFRNPLDRFFEQGQRFEVRGSTNFSGLEVSATASCKKVGEFMPS